MAHELMFDERDPMLARVRALALQLPGAQEKISHGRPAFFTQKVFAYFSAAVRSEGEWVQHPQSILVRADRGEEAALREMPDAFVPAYLGMSGWTGIDLRDDTDWTLITELVEESFRLTAPAMLLTELDTA